MPLLRPQVTPADGAAVLGRPKPQPKGTTLPYITHLTVENFKRITAVDISFDAEGGVTTISGPNGAGKTSVIDAIAAAVAGKNAPKTPNPIRKGEDKAVIIATTDEGLVVTRTYRRRDDDTITSSLTVTNAEGFTKQRPQDLLDAFLNAYALDPQAFATAKPADQKAELLSLVDLPFDPAELDAQEAEVFATRTDVNRRVREYAAQLAGMPPVDASAPDAEVSVSDLMQQLAYANDVEQRRATAARNLEAARADVERTQAAIERAQEQLQEDIANRDALIAENEFLPDAVDTSALREQIANVDHVNASVRDNAARIALANKHRDADEESKALTAKLDAIKQQRVDGLSSVQFPVDGLGFDDTGVTFGGVPFSQSSAGERLTASIAIAAAANPGLRLVLVRDASLLDAAHRQMVAEYAESHGLRIVMEVVDENAESGVVIEDGAVR